ncbi:hypothetical protein JG688_00018467 [Phytophthora aleatoria]|uniref:Transmembrane protein n=1 Tax=Phytophthora aleatoria TaxID=2496075 RepID=A0A8J5M0L7_9STRA|nr:hypothetical protein JG688_00018467 [Phytophthora aleatoria]
MLFTAYRTFIVMAREIAIALQLIILSLTLLVGIGHGFKVYVYMQVMLIFTGWAAIGLVYLTLGLLRHATLALVVYAVLLMLFVTFRGFLTNVADMPDWLVLLHYLLHTSQVNYVYEAMMKIFWKRVDSIDSD